MPREWQFVSHDTGLVKSLASQMRCSSLLAQVLLSRGFSTAEEAKGFLSAKLATLQEPEVLPGVAEAADLMAEAIRQKRRITIYGDYDVDGMTSTSILYHCITQAGGTVDYYIPCRMEEGYGLNCDAIRELHEADPERLVVTVDCGICSVKEADLARELGLDLIITDHHTIPDELPKAKVLVHPRLPGGEECFPHLCGAGVAFKLAWAVSKRLGDGQRSTERMREFLKSAVGLAMIGTVADVVPLVGENRLIVKYGLDTLRQQAGPGLAAMLQVIGLDKKSCVTAEDIAFGISPRLNAAGRLGQARLAVDLLTTNQTDRAAQLATYLDGLNKQRQTVERKILKQAREEIQQNPEWLEQPCLVIGHHDWHVGVIGIVASRIAEQFEKPTILIALNSSTGIGQGSGRTFGEVNLHAAVSTGVDLLETFGGHPAAIGLKVRADRLDEFRERINAQPVLMSEAEIANPRLIDAEVTLGELSVRAIKELEYLGPFGCENDRPIFVATGLELAEEPKTMGEGGRHLAIRVKHYGTIMRAISFGRGEWAEEMAATSGRLSVCFKPIINEFRGRESVELQIIDWRSDDASGASAAQTRQAATVPAMGEDC